LMLTMEERELLVDLLNKSLKDAMVEEHRTRAPSYREQIVKREEVVRALLQKLGHAAS